MAFVCVVVALAFLITGSVASTKYQAKQKVVSAFDSSCLSNIAFGRPYDLVVVMVVGVASFKNLTISL